jgi:hypothetical protein
MADIEKHIENIYVAQRKRKDGTGSKTVEDPPILE